MYKLIVAIVRREILEKLASALKEQRINFTYSEVKAFCGEVHLYQKAIHDRIRMEIVSHERDIEKVRAIIVENSSSGREGDGCLYIYILDKHVTFTPSEGNFLM